MGFNGKRPKSEEFRGTHVEPEWGPFPLSLSPLYFHLFRTESPTSACFKKQAFLRGQSPVFFGWRGKTMAKINQPIPPKKRSMRKYESTKTNQIHHFLSIFLMFSMCSILLPPATAIPSPPDPFGGAGTRRGLPRHPLLAGTEPTIQKWQFFAENLCRKFTAVSRV